MQRHPDVQDPFARLIQAAPDIADATSQTVIDKLLGVLEDAGVPDEAAKLTRAVESYYRYEDPAGNVCSYDKKTGQFKSPRGLSCRLVKAKGGGATMLKQLVLEQLQSPVAKVRGAYERGVSEVLKDLTQGPRRLWSKLSDAWKAGVLLTGLGAAVPRITGLKVKRDSKGKLDFNFEVAGVGKISIDGGKVQQLALNLPPVTLKRLTIKAKGDVSRTAQSGEVALVVPVKRTTVRAEAAYEREKGGAGKGHVDVSATRGGKRVDLEAGARLESGPDGRRVQTRAAAATPIAKGRGTVQASATSTFTPGDSRVPTEFKASVATPLNKTRTISMAAGVTGTITTGGGAVELASSPGVTLEVAGQLPTLNRRIRKAQQARQLENMEDAEEIAVAKRREAEILRTLQADPAPPEGERVALLQELDRVRDITARSGSVNRTPWHQRTYNGDLLVGVAVLGGLAWGHFKSQPTGGSR